VDLRKLLATLEERQEGYRMTWARMKRSDKVFVVALVAVGLLNIAVGSIMIWL
jgi:hypothetical protein